MNVQNQELTNFDRFMIRTANSLSLLISLFLMMFFNLYESSAMGVLIFFLLAVCIWPVLILLGAIISVWKETKDMS